MPLLKALAAQLLAVAAVVLSLRAGVPMPGTGALALLQGVAAAAIAAALRSERWWLPIHAAFVPALWAASQLHIAPGWYLAAFVGCALVFWSSYRTRVPLYLSNRATTDAVSGLLGGPRGRLLDIGSGTGALLVPLAARHPDWSFVGIESAPLPHLLARLSGRSRANLALIRDDFFAADWSGYDLVYAFLSPVPMERVWAKARTEMDRDSLLVSNSFEIPGVVPERIVEVGDRRRTRLFCYRPGPSKS